MRIKRDIGLFLGLCSAVLLLTAAAQAPKFPGGLFTANDGTNTIALDFDTSGVVQSYVNNEPLSQGTWQVKADTLTFGVINGPEGYSCASPAKYLWAFADNRLSFTMAGNDDCQVRRDALTGLTWTRG
jgi:hypothetical protein